MTQASSDLDTAAWIQQGTSFTVTYPLLLFHEIDFAVNEGYRSIPYGGVEVGGLLFGHAGQSSTRIETFRTIECEHAFGPSFVLSERDVSALKRQLDVAASDPDLQGLQAIGWFISHTRKGLQMNDRETLLFDQFFSKPGAITLLVKPERFKPTLFGFLVRPTEGELERDATGQTIILPLIGRAGQKTDPSVPSIRMPQAAAPREELFENGKPAEQAVPQPLPPELPAEEPTPEPAALLLPPEEPTLEPPPPVLPEPEPAVQPPASLPEMPEPERALATVPRKDALSPLDLLSPERRQVSQSFDARLTHDHLTRRMREEGTRSNTRLVTVLVLAAALGCAVGYWGYLQLPSATIALTVQSKPPALIVSWPPQQTRDSVYAAIRIDDSEPQPLSADDRIAGHTQLNVPDNNVKIELIVQHWMRDSRGIVRFVRAPKPAQPSPPASEEENASSNRHRRRSRRR